MSIPTHHSDTEVPYGDVYSALATSSWLTGYRRDGKGGKNQEEKALSAAATAAGARHLSGSRDESSRSRSRPHLRNNEELDQASSRLDTQASIGKVNGGVSEKLMVPTTAVLTRNGSTDLRRTYRFTCALIIIFSSSTRTEENPAQSSPSLYRFAISSSSKSRGPSPGVISSLRAFEELLSSTSTAPKEVLSSINAESECPLMLSVASFCATSSPMPKTQDPKLGGMSTDIKTSHPSSRACDSSTESPQGRPSQTRLFLYSSSKGPTTGRSI
ncbi:hypothetical protein M422DRAFT_775238 [Sphaerobolus stellatus SS14]|nr:hypothetical protein M422DRAFT_775238 [Sphaerobolus stellatus SS14]